MARLNRKLATGYQRALMVLALCTSLQSLNAQVIPRPREADGRPAVFGTPAVRIVALAPSLTELVFAAGAGDKLIAVSDYSDYPDAARKLPVVASAAGISWESVIALRPDLVLAWKGGTRLADIARLNSLGINVFSIEIKRLDDVAEALRAIGKLVGRPDPAEAAARKFLKELVALREANAAKPIVRTFMQISAKPLMTVNRDHVISEMIGLCGGENSFADAPTLVSEPSREELFARQPDAILFGINKSGEKPSNSAIYADLPAARVGKMQGITADHVLRPGPRLILATAEICMALDRVRAVQETEKIPRR
jgi:ABC-type Fe3+-hydroxamate transport system substrate-binding protein